MQNRDNAGEGMAAVLSCLEELEMLLTPRTAVVHRYEIPSQMFAREAEIEMAKWTTEGNKGFPPGLPMPAFRAAIYDIGRASAQLQAYRQVVSISLLEHADEAKAMLSQGRLMLGLGSLRGLIERVANLAENLRRLLAHLPDPVEDFTKILHAGEVIGRTLYSTRINWTVLAESELRTIKDNQMEYESSEYTSDMGAKSVMNGIDRLNKLVPGARASYAILCEFLHPNVGDLISTTIEAESFYDASGTRHMRRYIGKGANNLDKQIDMMKVIDSVLSISGTIIARIPTLFEQLDQLVFRVTEATRKTQHKTLRRYKHLFSRGDPCLCLSGRTIGQCSPVSLR